MMPTPALGTRQGMYDAVVRHPVARDPQWREVRAVIDHMSDAVGGKRSGRVEFLRDGETSTVHPPRRKDFSDVAGATRTRGFLERSARPESAVAGDGYNLLGVIDHREARIFRAEVHGVASERITPSELQGSNRHMHAVGDDANGQRKPESKAFYEAFLRALSGAEQILILGDATGAGSTMERLVNEMNAPCPVIAAHTVGAVVVDGNHMTDDQLLAHARTFFAAGRRRH